MPSFNTGQGFQGSAVGGAFGFPFIGGALGGFGGSLFGGGGPPTPNFVAGTGNPNNPPSMHGGMTGLTPYFDPQTTYTSGSPGQNQVGTWFGPRDPSQNQGRGAPGYGPVYQDQGGGILLQSGGWANEDVLRSFGGGALIQAALARQQLRNNLGASSQLYAGLDAPIQQQLDLVRQQLGPGGQLQRDLSSTLGSTAGATVAAGQAARMAGSGGNAQAAARRGAQAAAVNQSAMLGQALSQGTNQFLGMSNQLAGALTGVRSSQASALDDILNRESQMSFNIAQMMGGLAAPGSQITASKIGASSAAQTAGIRAAGQLVGGLMSSGG